MEQGGGPRKEHKAIAIKDFEASILESNNQVIYLIITVLAVLRKMFRPPQFGLIVKKKKCLYFWTIW